jgi:hypothetical protein
MDRALNGVTRALARLLGWAGGLVPPGRRGWAEAVRTEAGEVPAGLARVGWLAGGFWLVAREARMLRRIGYGLGIVAVALAAALVVRYIWHDGQDVGWGKARVILLLALMAGLPWVARRRGVFGPVGPSITARLVRAGGCAALVALVLDFTREERVLLRNPPGAWNWTHEAAGLGLIAACLAAVLIVPARWPKIRPVLVAWCATAAGLAVLFTLAPLQVMLTFYVAGILAVTSRRSPVTPATLALGAGVGAGSGLLFAVLWDVVRSRGPGADTSAPMTLFLLLVIVTTAATVAAAKIAEWRGAGTGDPQALRTARMWQCLAAGPLTAAAAAIMLPLVRTSAAVHYATHCPATYELHCSSPRSVWVFFLVIGPVVGLAIGTCINALAEAQPQPPRQPPRRPPPDPPYEPLPDGPPPGEVVTEAAGTADAVSLRRAVVHARAK